MTDHSTWFSDHLASSGEGLVWAVKQVPVQRQNQQPPGGLGEWSAARHVFHLHFYELTLALPSMGQWLGGALPVVQDGDEDVAWINPEPVEALIAKFEAVRSQQIALLFQLQPGDWDRTVATVWGPQNLLWVVTKTYQHTAEHISDVLRIALFWDIAAAREVRKD